MLSIEKINRLEKENAELKAENERLKEEVRTEKIYSSQIEELEESLNHLKQENDKLKEGIETRDNLIDHFRDEALYRATIASEYKKDRTKLEQTLQEIKAISEELLEKGLEPQSVEHQLRLKGKRELASIILDLITKAEEE